MTVENPLDVAVVGAGVSGVYTAWRLLDTGTRRDVAVFEAGERIGGRLFSVTMPGAPHLPVELGGMRFLDSQRRVVGLLERLKLATRRLEVDDPNLANLAYLRGTHFVAADWTRPGFSPPFRLDAGERLRSPGDLINGVALKYRERAAQLHGEGFWNLLYRELSSEAYALVREAGGYTTLINNWNAAVAVPFLLADFGLDVEYRALLDGFQTLPTTLAGEIGSLGGAVHRGQRLHRLDLDGTGPEPLVRLTFETDAPGDFAHCRTVRRPVVVHARHVVLALPRRAIELLHPDSVLFASPQFEDDLRAVVPQPALKIFAAYPQPWWTQSRGIVAGRSVTDLPIRQCYYWGTEGDQQGADRNNRNSILMASYNDGSAVEFWNGLAADPERHPPRVAMAGTAEPFDPAMTAVRASRALVRELGDQLAELHGIERRRLPEPYETVFQDWSSDPYGGGWHFWRIHQRPEQVMPRIQQPCGPTVPISVCGEAWSTQQGWVEGALETADAILAREFKLDPPEGASPPLRGFARAQAALPEPLLAPESPRGRG